MSWKNFSIDEFKCHHCGVNLIDYAFVDRLQSLRDHLGFPLPINSGYRCPEYNRQVSTTGDTGPHTTGHAADIEVDRYNAFVAVSYAHAHGFTGIGVAQKGEKRYIHLDDLPNAPGQPRPTVWSY